jgi:riboflavin kinase
MVQKWTFGLPGMVPTRLVEDPYYLMTVQRLERATTLPSLLRFRGVVDTGCGRGGGKLGVPTASLPAHLFQNALATIEPGVYFGWVTVEHYMMNQTTFQAVVNVGYSPTFQGEENKEKIIEAHLIDGKGLDDFYGQVMRLELSGYLRPEKKFDSFPQLLAQIQADITEANNALGGSPYVELRDSSPLFLEGHGLEPVAEMKQPVGSSSTIRAF